MSEYYKNLSLDNLPGEEWKDIKDYEGIYQVSNMGRVKGLEREYYPGNRGSKQKINEYIKTQRLAPNGYLMLSLFNNGNRKNFRVHRLVAEAFIPNPDNKPQVNHIDECKTNNTVSNLNWMTSKENNNHGTKNERCKETTKKNNSSTIHHAISAKKRKVRCINTGEIFDSVTEACSKYNIKSTASISDCCNGKQKSAGRLGKARLKWEYIPED